MASTFSTTLATLATVFLLVHCIGFTNAGTITITPNPNDPTVEKTTIVVRGATATPAAAVTTVAPAAVTTTIKDNVVVDGNKGRSGGTYNAQTSDDAKDEDDGKNKPMFSEGGNIAVFVCFAVCALVVIGTLIVCLRKKPDSLTFTENGTPMRQVSGGEGVTGTYVAKTQDVVVSVGDN